MEKTTRNPDEWLGELESAAAFFVELRSDRNYIVSENGEVFGPSSSWSGMRGAPSTKPIKGVLINGYLRIKVRANGRRVLRWAHHLVLEAFGFGRVDGMHAAHKNGVRTDNRIDNLGWFTPKENNAHKLAHGTLLFGDRHPRIRIPESEVDTILHKLNHGATAAGLAREYGVTTAPIHYIKNRKRHSLRSVKL